METTDTDGALIGIIRKTTDDDQKYTQRGDREFIERIRKILEENTSDAMEDSDRHILEILAKGNNYPKIGTVVEVTDSSLFFTERVFGSKNAAPSWRRARKGELLRIRKIYANDTTVLEIIGNPKVYLTIDFYYLRGNYRLANQP